MVKRTLYSCLLLILTSVVSGAEIELMDGSRIQGEVAGISGGAYVIVSDVIGTLRIAKSRVRAIHQTEKANNSLGQSSGSDTASQIRALQQQLNSNPDMQNSVDRIRDDPEVGRILGNEKLLQAVQANDFNTLMNDPDFQRLMRNPEVRQLLQQFK